MRLTKAVLSGVAALALSTGAAFAGGDSMSEGSYQSYEQGGPELLSESQPMTPLEDEYSMQSPEYSAQAPQEYEVYELYVVPEVAVVPGVDSEGNPLNVIN